MLKFAKLVVFVAVMAELALAQVCNNGDILCCNQFTTAGSPNTASLLQQLGIVVLDPNTGVGLNCSPLNIVGVGGNSWYAATQSYTSRPIENLPLKLDENSL